MPNFEEIDRTWAMNQTKDTPDNWIVCEDCDGDGIVNDMPYNMGRESICDTCEGEGGFEGFFHCKGCDGDRDGPEEQYCPDCDCITGTYLGKD